MTEKKVRVKEERHFVAVRRYARKTVFQALFIHAASSALMPHPTPECRKGVPH
ncbi:MAG TPA: hypothetical protein VN714_02375 [Trebonia sp.]|nr:hypothetical protein [Trebonia sp.]